MAPRNDHYKPNWAPFEGHSDLAYSENTAKGVISWMNPTQARFTGVPHVGATQELKQNVLPPGCQHNYNTRDARKGRHALIIDPTNYENKQVDTPSPTNSPKAIVQTIWRMFSTLPITNLSWYTAIIFTAGSADFVACSFMSFLPLNQPAVKQKNPKMATEYGGWAAFAGSVVFVLGSIFMILEAVNERRTACFGYSIYQEFDDSNPEIPTVTKYMPTKARNSHAEGVMRKAWIWLPTWKEFREHYWHELGFLACMIQAVSSLFFFWSNVCAMPPIYNSIASNTPLLAGVYWFPKVVGCTGFIISGILLTLETQPAWVEPAFGTIGWWIGMLKVIGGIGFLLGAAFGYNRAESAQYHSALSTLWGSFAFLIGSLLLWFEALQPFPVHVKRINRLGEHDEEKHEGSTKQLKASNVGGTHDDDVERNDGVESDSVGSGGFKDSDANVEDNVTTPGSRDEEAPA